MRFTAKAFRRLSRRRKQRKQRTRRSKSRRMQKGAGLGLSEHPFVSLKKEGVDVGPRTDEGLAAEEVVTYPKDESA